MTIETTIEACLALRLKHYLTIAKTKPKRQYQDQFQAGFATPLALGMGLVTMIVAATIIGRSQSDRTTTNFQKETNRASSVSEAGVVRFQAFLDRHKLLATKNLDRWVDTLDLLPSSQVGCNSLLNFPLAKQQAQIFKDREWINLDNNDLNKGRYKVVDYRYQNGLGKLTIDGEITADNTTQNSSSSRLAVEIPIGSESAKISPPALWANTFSLSPNQKITGQIRAVTCPQLPVNDADGVVGVDLSNIALISSIPSGQIIADPFTPIPAPKVAPNTAILLPAITSSIQLPRRVGLNDLPDANNEYHYLVDLDNQTSGYSIKLQDIDRLKIDVSPGQKVNLYLKGNIDLAGSQTVNVDRHHPNLRIYGSDRTTKLIIKDTASITAFIHAPSAEAQSIGSGSPVNPSVGIFGAVWVKSWDSTTSPSELPISQTGTWADLGASKAEQPPQLSPITYWQQVEGR